MQPPTNHVTANDLMIYTARIMPAGQVRVQQGMNQCGSEDRRMWLEQSGLKQVMIGGNLKMWVRPAHVRHGEFAHLNPAATALAHRAGHHTAIYGPVLISAGPVGEPPLGLSSDQIDQVRDDAGIIMRAVSMFHALHRDASPGTLLDVAAHAASDPDKCEMVRR